MLLPIGDTPNPSRFTAVMNWALIAINVAVYVFIALPLSIRRPSPSDPLLREYLDVILPSLAPGVSVHHLLSELSAYDLFVFEHGYKPGAPEFVDLVSSMFLHGGLAHLAGNMLFLWIFGDNVEHRLGRVRYLVLYLVTGVAATLTFSAFAGSARTPLVGASGAISGVLGLYFIMFPRNSVKVFIVFFPFLVDVVLIPVRWVLVFYVVAQNLLPALVGAQSGVAYGAHLGGFFGGVVLALIGERTAWRWPWADREARGSLNLREAPAQECLETAERLAFDGQFDAAAHILRQSIGRASRWSRTELARAHVLLGEIRIRQGQTPAAYQHLLTALDMGPDAEDAVRARRALAMIEVYERKRR